MGTQEAIGRYSIVGQLAIGGTAEVLLGRLGGPNRFERLVVIKRLLPQLATKPEFRAMFLDEARIAARIHHQNVVQVQELVDDGRELYLAMEYLDGESVSNLLRRCVAHGRRVPFGLAAFIIAEACAGLHSAHSLTDANGQPLELVHRDVSPQNVIVTYDGEVKILDFGIAKAAGRITKTEAGVIKGKFLYMSPEQATAKPLDRRTDIFALGTVLYELSTGRALFKRPSHVQVIKAICDDPIVPPSRVAPDIPKALEQVCLRALARDREQRYESAAAMRRDLLPIVRELLPSSEAGEDLSALMKSLFDDRALEKKQMLVKVELGTKIDALPAAETDEATEVPGIDEDAVVALEAGERSSRSEHESRDAKSTRRRLISAAVAVVSVAGLLVIASAAAFQRRPAQVGVEEPTPISAAETPALASAAPATEGQAGEPQKDVQSVLVRIATVPPGALIKIDGEARGTAPIELRLPKDRASKVAVSKPGYAASVRTIEARVDEQLVIPLTLEKKSGGPGASRSRPRTPPSPPGASPATSSPPTYRFDRF